MSQEFTFEIPSSLRNDVREGVKFDGALVDELKRKALEFLKDFAGTREDFVAQIRKAYDTVIAPIDIPYIPNFIEVKIDDAIGDQIEIWAKSIYDRFLAAKQAAAAV